MFFWVFWFIKIGTNKIKSHRIFWEDLEWNYENRFKVFVERLWRETIWDLYEGTFLERLWHEAIWQFSQRVSLRDSRVTNCEICLECFALRLLYEKRSWAWGSWTFCRNKIKTGKHKRNGIKSKNCFFQILRYVKYLCSLRFFRAWPSQHAYKRLAWRVGGELVGVSGNFVGA